MHVQDESQRYDFVEKITNLEKEVNRFHELLDDQKQAVSVDL